MRLILLATAVAFICQVLASMAGADATTPAATTEGMAGHKIAAVPKQGDGPIVILAVVIEPDGSISNATVAQGTGVASIDWAAVQKARQMHVPPARVNGTPVRAQTKIAVRVPSQAQSPKAARPAIKTTPVVQI